MPETNIIPYSTLKKKPKEKGILSDEKPSWAIHTPWGMVRHSQQGFELLKALTELSRKNRIHYSNVPKPSDTYTNIPENLEDDSQTLDQSQ